MVGLSGTTVEFFPSLIEDEIGAWLLTSWEFKALREISTITVIVWCFSVMVNEYICTTKVPRGFMWCWEKGSVWSSDQIFNWHGGTAQHVWPQQSFSLFFLWIYHRAMYLVVWVWRLQSAFRRELWAQHPRCCGFFWRFVLHEKKMQQNNSKSKIAMN